MFLKPTRAIGYPSFIARWDYRKGDAKRLLPSVLLDENVDLFVHDSLHTTSHMAFEYATARALFGEKAIITPDDILWNQAFECICETKMVSAPMRLSAILILER
jgi:hypothetical protein